MTVYLDMDGVIADFFGGIAKRFGVDHWKSIKDRDTAFVELRNTDFFGKLKTFRDENQADLSAHIVRSVQMFSDGDWGICSSPLRGDDFNSAYWKRVWLQDNGFVPPNLEDMIFTGNKHKYAVNPLTRKPNILIDDKPENIRRWEQAGGIGIRFQTNEDDIEEYLFPALEDAIERSRTA